MRACGILLPIASLPSKYGIGSFSKSAYEFVDLLVAAGQNYWQILPLGPTGYGDSPYQSFSTFAGNPYFIDLDVLVEKGWLETSECAAYDYGNDSRYIDYGKLYQSRFQILRTAFERSHVQEDPAYQIFVNENKKWLFDYCLYMAVKNHFQGISWDEWQEDIRGRQPEAMRAYQERFKEEIAFFGFLQFEFSRQWLLLKRYANEKGIQIIGDIPVYVAFDSADTWASPELFQFDERHRPLAVAGCPPDGFSATGQLWGNPLYNWEYHKKTEYSWWAKRIAHCFTLYDVVRVDHFRGFDEYYSIPYGAATAEFGEWRPGPGLALFKTLKSKLGDVRIIAEDLGYQTPSVVNMVKDSGYPGMKVLEFAFDSREDSDYLPHNYEKNCVVYTGTHDNQTLQAWYQELQKEDRAFAKEYLDLYDKDEDTVHWAFIRAALSSVADLAIIPIQDYLGLGAEARINTPSTIGNNWTWRLQNHEISPQLIEKIKTMVKMYGR